MHKLEMTRYSDGQVIHTKDITGMSEKQVKALKKQLSLRFRPDYYYPQLVKVVRVK